MYFNELLNPKGIVSTANFSTETENNPKQILHVLSELAAAMNIVTYIATSISMEACT